MKEKIVKYDDVIAVYKGEKFNAGGVTYKEYIDKDSGKIEFLSGKIDIGIAILPDKRKNFIKELTDLISKYAV